MEREAKADQLESREMVSRLRSAGILEAFINSAPQNYNKNVRKPEDHTVQNILEKKDELRGDPGMCVALLNLRRNHLMKTYKAQLK